MGTDNLFHKRKAQDVRSLQRRKASREPYAKVLIVCEGEKTEPLYFRGLIDHYGLSSANVEVCGECGSDPISILKHARQRYREEKDAGDPFDKVYCVFDKDCHANYTQAINTIHNLTPKGVYIAVTSVPCFEYWLLLHFTYTTKAYKTCDQVLADLKNYVPNYSKGSRDIFSELINQIDFAKKNAVRVLSESEKTNTDNPTTYVHELVSFLQDIKK